MISAYVDRFEGRYAVLLLGEEMQKLNFPRELLPSDVEEGDYVKMTIERDAEATEKALQEALSLED